MTPPVPELIGTAKAAAWLGLSEERVRFMCREGRLEGAFQPSGYLGKWLIPTSSLERIRKRPATETTETTDKAG